MRKLLGTLVILGVIVVAVGFARGWFVVEKDDRPDKTNVNIEVDKDKIRHDASAAKDKINKLTD